MSTPSVPLGKPVNAFEGETKRTSTGKPTHLPHLSLSTSSIPKIKTDSTPSPLSGPVAAVQASSRRRASLMMGGSGMISHSRTNRSGSVMLGPGGAFTRPNVGKKPSTGFSPRGPHGHGQGAMMNKVFESSVGQAFSGMMPVAEIQTDRKIFFLPGYDDDDHQTSKQTGQSAHKTVSHDSSDERRSTAPQEYNFSEIVDIDEHEAYENFVGEDLLGKLLDSWQFRAAILFVIVVNSLLIGLQTDKTIEDKFAGILGATDSMILTIFIVEILLKWYHGFWMFWFVGWNVFDFLIVFSSLLGPSVTFVSSGRVLRILRVLRAFRTLRSISALQGLQVIVQTLLKSLPDMGNIVGLLLILMFIFAVVGVNLFATALPQFFGTMADNMFTLFIMMTQDGWAQIFAEVRAVGMFGPGAAYFAIFIVLGAFVFINIIVGVTVTNLQTAYGEIKRQRKHRHRELKRKKEHGKSVPVMWGTTRGPQGKGPDFWANQLPLEVPSLNTVPLVILERYFLILSAIEDNLAEHNRLKNTIQQISNDMKMLNASLRGAPIADVSSSFYSEESSRGSYDDDQPADYLTEVIKRHQNEQKRQKEHEKHLVASMAHQRALFGDLEEEQTRTELTEIWAAGGQKEESPEQDKHVSFISPRSAARRDTSPHSPVNGPTKPIMRQAPPLTKSHSDFPDVSPRETKGGLTRSKSKTDVQTGAKIPLWDRLFKSPSATRKRTVSDEPRTVGMDETPSGPINSVNGKTPLAAHLVDEHDQSTQSIKSVSGVEPNVPRAVVAMSLRKQPSFSLVSAMRQVNESQVEEWHSEQHSPSKQSSTSSHQRFMHALATETIENDPMPPPHDELGEPSTELMTDPIPLHPEVEIDTPQPIPAIKTPTSVPTEPSFDDPSGE